MEEWKSVPGFPEYEASTEGRIRSLSRSIQRNGRPASIQGRVLSTKGRASGYSAVVLSARGLRKQVSVHTIIALTFIGPKPTGSEVMHIDGNRDNNRSSNLRYGSHRCNEAFKMENGTHLSGDKCPWAKLTSGMVSEIRALRRLGFSTYQLARNYGVQQTTIMRIIHNKTWR